MTFAARTGKPEAGNKYYIRKESGGYSNAVRGYPKDSECDVLSNCVGYAYGRFNEIGGYGYCKYLAPVNAENFMQYRGSCLAGKTPKPGSCMVWQKGKTLSGSDGAGHVAIVEKLISDTEVYTSESGYGTKAFWNQTRKKGSDGRWGAGPEYVFLGFIYNPAVEAESPPPESDPSLLDSVSAGDTVRINDSAVYYGSAKPVPAWVKNKAWIVHSISGERAVIDKSDDGKNSICSPIHVKYLSAIKQSGRVNDSYALAPYTVKVTASALNIREGAGTDYPIVSCIWDKGIYTVVEEKAGTGASKWGRLKSGAGWIALDYTVKQQHR